MVEIVSFAYKRGPPPDADLLFDVRDLPNPYWDRSLRELCGKDGPVKAFFDAEPLALATVRNIVGAIERHTRAEGRGRRPEFTVAIGCTGGQHRSVFVAESVAEALSSNHGPPTIRHRDLA